MPSANAVPSYHEHESVRYVGDSASSAVDWPSLPGQDLRPSSSPPVKNANRSGEMRWPHNFMVNRRVIYEQRLFLRRCCRLLLFDRPGQDAALFRPGFPFGGQVADSLWVLTSYIVELGAVVREVE